MRRFAVALAILTVTPVVVLPLPAAQLEVSDLAATIGTYGLEVTIGPGCGAPDSVTLTAVDDPATGAHRACLSLAAENLQVQGVQVLFRAGSTVTLGEGFSVATDADFEVRLDDYLASSFAFLVDHSPISENVYNARFYLQTDGLSLAGGDEIAHFVAYSGDGSEQFRLLLEPASGGSGHVFALEARENGGGVSLTAPGQEVPLAAGWNKVEIEWAHGAGDGRFEISVNDGPFSGLGSLTNDASLVESVRLGAVDGQLAGSSGAMRLDGFDSWR